MTNENVKLDKAPRPGGLYIVGGKVVDANGKELDGWMVDSNGNAVQVVESQPTGKGK